MLCSASMVSRTRHGIFEARGGLYAYVESEVLRANKGNGKVSVDDRANNPILPKPFLSFQSERNLVTIDPTLTLLSVLTVTLLSPYSNYNTANWRQTETIEAS